MLSAGSITVKCGDFNDQSTRLVTGRVVARFASRHYRIFKARSGLQRKKRVLLDAYVKNPGDKATLIKIMRGVRWNHLSKSFTAYFMRDFAASSAGKFIAAKYNRRSLNRYLVIPIWRQVFTSRPATLKCSANPSATVSRPAPLPRPRPATPHPSPVTPRRSTVNRIKLQRALVKAVKKVRKFRKYSDARAKGVLKYSWTMLTAFKVAPHILRVFRKFRDPSLPADPEAKLKEILRTWQTSSVAVQPTRTPARPAPTRPVTPARPRPVDSQLKIRRALIKAVKKVRKFKKYSDKRAKGVLRYSWTMLQAFKVAPRILRVFRKFGKPTLPKAAEAELKVILSKWK